MRAGWVPLFVTAFALTLISPRGAQAQTSWVGTWAAAPSAENNASGTLPEQTTLRQVVHVSRGGTTVRITLTNELGVDSLTVSGGRIGLRLQENDAGASHTLTFDGAASVTVPPGAVAVSDPVPLRLPALSDMAITLLLPAQPLHVWTVHSLGLQTNEQAAGDQLAAAPMTGAKRFEQWRLLKNVEVQSSTKAGGAIVTLGDSITDGFRSTPEANRRWPDVLAQRLQADKKLRKVSVLNEGISGNRLLHDNAGPNVLARLDRDVLSQSGVRYLIVLEGINDIGRTAEPHAPGDAITTQQILAAYGQIVDRAHAHGIKVYGATLTPFLGAGYARPEGEAMRQAVNTWIRTSGRFDGVIDFDKVTRDAAHPGVFSPAADSGDHLHPGDRGYRLMGDSLDLTLFEP